MKKRDWKMQTSLLTLALTALVAGIVIGAPADEVRSGNGAVAVRLEAASDRNVVYQVADGKDWYSLPNLPGQVFLSEDGTYAAVCNHWLASGYRPKDVVVQFYRTGTATAGLTLKVLLDEPKALRREGTHHRWGQCEGFVKGSTFALDTIEAKRISFDPATGERNETRGIWPPRQKAAQASSTTAAPAAKSDPALTVQDFIPDNVCRNEDDWLFCDEFKGGYKGGWKQVRGKWLVRPDFTLRNVAFSEHVLYQRSDQQREGNALLYYDNQNFSDVDISTMLLMDLTFPQLALEEDDMRIRRLRRIAGAGIVFRLQDENNYYMFRLAGEEGAVLGKMVNGEWFDLANPRAVDFLNANLRYADSLYGLRVRTQGSRIQCFLYEWPKDGRPSVEQALVSLHDDTFAVGRAGLVTFEAQADFLFFAVSR